MQPDVPVVAHHFHKPHQRFNAFIDVCRTKPGFWNFHHIGKIRDESTHVVAPFDAHVHGFLHIFGSFLFR
ncbi:hypothetical protein SDC9_89004 [bioreactor metagenome]|uniref:Uncharacterized protein n=1 Tax=bioreactor metagenome TaxID=1076179 RepID=A0A644ZN17_9ZZZZ